MTREELQALPLAEQMRLAQDPLTPPVLLEVLYDDWEKRRSVHSDDNARAVIAKNDPEKEMGEALARHPNTPLHNLLFLAAVLPTAFCRNPITPLLPLEVPDLVLRMTQPGLGALLRTEETPAALVRLIAQQAPTAELRAEAAHHVALAGELGKDWLDQVRSALTAYSRDFRSIPNTLPLSRRLIKSLADWGGVPDFIRTEDNYALPPSPRAPAPEELEPDDLKKIVRLLLDQPGYRRRNYRLACFLGLSHPWITEADTLPHHASSPIWLERLGVALNPALRNLRPIAESLAADGNRYVRAAARARVRGEDISL